MGAIKKHFFVGADNTAAGAPPYLGVIVISKSFGVDVFCNFLFPLLLYFFRNRQLRNRPSFLELLIEPCIIESDKDPLCPFKIFRIGCIDLSFPVVAEAEFLYLSRNVSQLFFVVIEGCVPVWMAYCSAGSPNASQPIG